MRLGRVEWGRWDGKVWGGSEVGHGVRGKVFEGLAAGSVARAFNRNKYSAMPAEARRKMHI